MSLRYPTCEMVRTRCETETRAAQLDQGERPPQRPAAHRESIIGRISLRIGTYVRKRQQTEESGGPCRIAGADSRSDIFLLCPDRSFSEPSCLFRGLSHSFLSPALTYSSSRPESEYFCALVHGARCSAYRIVCR